MKSNRRPGRLRRLAALGPRRRRLLAEAVVRLAQARLALRLRPFDKAIRAGLVPPASVAGDRIADCAWAVTAAAARVPWRAMCIEQGIALQRMLRRRGVDASLHYGLAIDPDRAMKAHVWVSVSGTVVIGGDPIGDYSCVATFG